MSAAHPLKAAPAAGAAASPRTTGRAQALALVRRLAARLGNEWLPLAVWSIGRTGKPGLAGLGLLVAAAAFLLSTHLPVVAEVDALRADLAAARSRKHEAAAPQDAESATAALALPSRIDLPEEVHRLFEEARKAQLAVDTARYELTVTKGSGLLRYQVSFPVAGSYPRIRAFLDSTLADMPAVALNDLVLERKSIASPEVEAQLRMTVYAELAGAMGPRRAGPSIPLSGRKAADRAVEPSYAEALFAPHSWYVRPPPPPPPPPPPEAPPPEPTAPALPYVLVGSYAPRGAAPVFFLSRGDRVIDAHVGDRLDGVYQLESASEGQLVFVYLPLNTRQTLALGGPR